MNNAKETDGSEIINYANKNDSTEGNENLKLLNIILIIKKNFCFYYFYFNICIKQKFYFFFFLILLNFKLNFFTKF